jgi:hypothetical protein
MKIRVPNCAAALKLAISFGVLGVVSAIPAAADTLDLNTGTGPGSVAYTITADTLNPDEGTTATVVSTLGYGWANDLSSEWIAPIADQFDPPASGEYAVGYVTYQTTFSLPTGLDPGSTISITFLADDWLTATLNGNMFYTGPSGCDPQLAAPYLDFCSSDPESWTSHTTLTIPDNLLTSGLNTLSFTVWNTGGTTSLNNDPGGSATGLDAQVVVDYTDPPSPAPTPEPPTALTFASALAVGFAFWRLRGGRQTAS